MKLVDSFGTLHWVILIVAFALIAMVKAFTFSHPLDIEFDHWKIKELADQLNSDNVDVPDCVKDASDHDDSHTSKDQNTLDKD